jgi:vancomycin resistance protein VanJ
LTVERYRDESVNPPVLAAREELDVAPSPQLPRQRRTDEEPGRTASGPLTEPAASRGRTALPALPGQAAPAGDSVLPAIAEQRREHADPDSGSGSFDGPGSGSPGDPDGPGGGPSDGPGAEDRGRDGSTGRPPAEQPPPPPGAPSPRHKPWPSPRQQIATAVMVLSSLITLFLLGHRYLPGTMGVASLLESWLPWLAIPIGVLLLSAAAVHKPRALIASAVAAAVWLAGYGPALLPRSSGLSAQLRVFSVDVNGQPGELSRAGAMAVAQHADLVTLQDVYGDLSTSAAEARLNAAYPSADHVTQYEFGVWSKYPIVSSEPIDLGTSSSDPAGGEGQGLVADGIAQQVFGALKVTIATPQGALVVYVVHIPQPTLNDSGFATARNAAVKRFAAVIDADPAQRLIVVGNVNIAATDREFSAVQQGLKLTSAQSAAGQGFGFTWPAEFPAVRLDDLLSRAGVTAVRSVVMPSIGTGKTHLPIMVDLHL